MAWNLDRAESRPERGRQPAALPLRGPGTRFLAVLGLSLILVVAIAAVLLCRSLSQEVLAERQRDQRNLALALAEQLQRTLQAVDLIQRDIIEDVRESNAIVPAALLELFGTPAFHMQMRDIVSALPQVDAVSLVDANGLLVNSSRIWPVPLANLSTRDYFQVLSRPDTPDVYVSEPIPYRDSGVITIYIARRITAPDGTFAGVVAGAILQSHVDEVFRSLHLDKDATIVLARNDGAVLASYPPLPRARTTPSDRTALAAAIAGGKESGSLPAGALDDKRRIASIQSLPKYSLSLLVSDSMRSVEKDGRRLIIPIAVASGLLCLALAIITLFALRQLRIHSAYAEAAHAMARKDSLTGLPNRLALGEALEAASLDINGRPFAVLFLDLDYFKSVNDTLGHAVGDDLLKAVAQRLRTAVGAHDLVARLGGDEFAILRRQTDNAGATLELAERVITHIREPFEIGAHRVVAGGSIGFALSPRDGTTPETLMKKADLSLYQAKGAGRGVARGFVRSMEVQATERRQLELDLREAWSSGQFYLAYQPIFESCGLRLSGFEALLRWRHPRRGLVPPSIFIPVAEETGLIHGLGQFVLREACRAAASWPAHLRVAVNLSPIQFRNSRIDDAVSSTLAETGLSPRRLDIEITESALLQEGLPLRIMLERLRASGITIALDDFGTGYSSLAYLRTLPIGRIKIDRKFVEQACDDARSLAIVRTILRLASALSLEVTAEGVEEGRQLDLLRREACTHLQGYLLSPPVDGETATRMAHEALEPDPLRLNGQDL